MMKISNKVINFAKRAMVVRRVGKTLAKVII